jgi:hypothetical protein
MHSRRKTTKSQQESALVTGSHASALARGNVVWAVLPSYGKGSTLAPARTKTIQPIKTKFGKRDYVPGIT